MPKASNVVSMPDSAASLQPQTEAKLTYNRRFGDESITIRTATVEELMELRNRLAEQIPALTPPQAPDRSYFAEGDSCPRDTCEGKIYLRTGSKDGRSWKFWGCSGYPTCKFTAKA